jgi:hypothetical protein
MYGGKAIGDGKIAKEEWKQASDGEVFMLSSLGTRTGRVTLLPASLGDLLS